jgi:hypothetical protein
MLGEHAASHVDVTPFDILIGADGARSLVRSQLGIDFPAQTSFKMANKFPQSYPEVNQVSFIVNFNTINGECPPVTKSKATGDEIVRISSSCHM